MKKILLSITVLAMTINLSAQSELKTKSISIFKNGQSFVIKEGTVPTENKKYTLKEVPNALFGTLWFNGVSSKIQQITSKQDSVKKTLEQNADNFPKLLFANKGQVVTITTSDDKVYNGKLEGLESPDSPIITIQSDAKWYTIATSSIKNIEFASKPQMVGKLNQYEQKLVINVYFEGAGKQQMEMMYLQNGLSWTPTYLLELISDSKARIKFQAEISNDTEDIQNVDISLVVGVPNFKFANMPATLTSFSGSTISNGNYYKKEAQFSNALMGQMFDEKVAERDVSSVSVNSESEATGDFYFYKIKNLTIPKNGRGVYPVFDDIIDIKHIYECTLTPDRGRNANYNSLYAFDPVMANVYHTIEVNNKTKNPFTTGSVMVMDQKTQRPLVEDLLKYTPINQSSTVKLTTSSDIRVKEQDKIVNSEKEDKTINGYKVTYLQVSMESEVIISNNKKEEIEMSLKKTLEGKIEKASIKYSDRQVPNTNGDSYNLNPIDYIDFNIKLKAGETYKFTYSYTKYIRI